MTAKEICPECGNEVELHNDIWECNNCQFYCFNEDYVPEVEKQQGE